MWIFLSMTYEEFLRQLGKSGLTVREFAETLKMRPNSVTNCAQRAAVPSHLAVIVTLMGEMAEQGMDFRKCISRIEIAPKKARGASDTGRFGGSRQRALFQIERDQQ